jgi:uncharacterized membrane protein
VAPIVASIEIERSPEDVFAYLDDLSRHGEWQELLESTVVETEGPTRVGSRAVDARRVPGGRTISVTYEIVEHDPPRRSAFRGVDGPVPVVGSVAVEPAGEGRSRVTLDLDFRGRGLVGAFMAPIARRQARKQVPKDQQRLKEILEARA